MEKVLILGASGSIGHQTLDILKANKDKFCLVGFSVGTKVDLIDEILKEFPSVKFICTKNEKYESTNITCFNGDEGLISLIKATKPTLVVNALVGFVGLSPTVYCLENNIDVALANKEALVVGGELIRNILKTSKAKIYPIDSEHVAISKCLKGNFEDVTELILTASGGAFRDLSREELKNVTKEDALKHPSWNMGDKITIDCATMMNKGFEIIEAYYLFNIDIDNIKILLHDESKIHSLILLKDGSYLADIGPSDMHLPISYALFRGNRETNNYRLNLEDFGTFHFRKFDANRYPCVGFALKAIKVGGTMPATLNAANEIAVRAFLENKISFLQIEEIISYVLDTSNVILKPSLSELIKADENARLLAINYIKENLL